jgi:branched-chain amino acid transport system ATP-binding protein
MLEVRDLFAGYGVIQILRGVSLDVGRGEIVALLGSNGAGKSTLNNVLSRITPQTAGSVRFDGEDIHAASPARVVELGLIQVPEGRRIFPNLTVRENLELGSFRRGRARRPQPRRVGAIFPRLAERWERLPVRFRAASSRCSPSAAGHVGAEAAHPRRAVARAVAPAGRDHVRLDPAHQQDGLSILLVEQNVAVARHRRSRLCARERRHRLAGRASGLVDNRPQALYLGI